MKNKNKTTAYLGAIAGIVLGIVVALLMPFAGLDTQASLTFGILVWAIIWWVLNILPEMLTAFIMAVLFIAVADVPADSVFSSFASETWWLLLAAFGLGVGMKESGLLIRIAHGVLGRFAPRFKSQVFALIASGTVLGPFIPSMTAKLAVLEPLAMGIGDSLNYQRKGRQMNGLFLAALTGVRTIGPAIISASIIGYALLAFYPDEIQSRFNMVSWFLAALPWFVVTSCLNYAAIVLLYGPRDKRDKKGKRGKKEAAHPSTHPPTDSPARPSHKQDLGPMTSREKKMLAIITTTVLLWILEPLHGIPSAAVALGGTAVLLACGVCSTKEFKTGMNWESLLFIGIVMSLSSVFSYTGIDDWIVTLIEPTIEQLAFSPFVFIAGIAIITIVLRFIIVSEMAYVNIFMAFMVPMAISLGINPWVVGFTVYTMVNPWFMPYQNPIYLAAFYSVDGEMVDHGPMAAYCVLYLLICLIALMISVPFWLATGIWTI